MHNIPGGGFSDRLKTSAEARKALLSKFQPKPRVVAEEAPDRAAQRAAELEQVRANRREAKAAKALAVLETAKAEQEALDNAAATALEAKRGDIRLMRFADPQPNRVIGLAWRRSSPRAYHFIEFGELITSVMAEQMREAQAA